MGGDVMKHRLCGMFFFVVMASRCLFGGESIHLDYSCYSVGIHVRELHFGDWHIGEVLSAPVSEGMQGFLAVSVGNVQAGLGVSSTIDERDQEGNYLRNSLLVFYRIPAGVDVIPEGMVKIELVSEVNGVYGNTISSLPVRVSVGSCPENAGVLDKFNAIYGFELLGTLSAPGIASLKVPAHRLMGNNVIAFHFDNDVFWPPTSQHLII